MIDNTQDLIDSRDIIERLAVLDPFDADNPLTDEEDAERAALLKLALEAADYAEDWLYGVTLIRDSYFKDYAYELADDIGALRTIEGQSWPMCHIDWQAAADSLRQDYTAVDFDGVTYWVR